MSENHTTSFALELTHQAALVAERNNITFTTDRLALDAIAGQLGIQERLPEDVRVVLDHEPKPEKPRELKVDQPGYSSHDIAVKSAFSENAIGTQIANRLFKHPSFNPAVAGWYRTQEKIARLSRVGVLSSLVVCAGSLGINELNPTAGFVTAIAGVATLIGGGAAYITHGIREIVSEPSRPPVHTTPPVAIISNRNV